METSKAVFKTLDSILFPYYDAVESTALLEIGLFMTRKSICDTMQYEYDTVIFKSSIQSLANDIPILFFHIGIFL